MRCIGSSFMFVYCVSVCQAAFILRNKLYITTTCMSTESQPQNEVDVKQLKSVFQFLTKSLWTGNCAEMMYPGRPFQISAEAA